MCTVQAAAKFSAEAVHQSVPNVSFAFTGPVPSGGPIDGRDPLLDLDVTEPKLEDRTPKRLPGDTIPAHRPGTSSPRPGASDHPDMQSFLGLQPPDQRLDDNSDYRPPPLDPYQEELYKTAARQALPEGHSERSPVGLVHAADHRCVSPFQ